ncbi:hypothetical protein AYO22_00073 [Fonsecaea multimorphosa]|nr:hypothetical protein AYO22_00073 [Fonsecaea multimorphosa]
MSSPPTSNGLRIVDESAFGCRVRVVSIQVESPSVSLIAGSSVAWSFDDLAKMGFQEGAACWVTVDIEGGQTNLATPIKFILVNFGPTLTWVLTGTDAAPSWEGPS